MVYIRPDHDRAQHGGGRPSLWDRQCRGHFSGWAKGKYTDAAYQERFLRWFEFAKFLPMTRVHGYMTDTEFWRYGDTMERVARFYLELRYRLLPYTNALAAEASAARMPLIRPLALRCRVNGQWWSAAASD